MGKKTAYLNKNKKEKKELKELAYEKKKEMKLSTSHPYVQCIKAPYRKIQRTSSSRHSNLAQTETGKKQTDEKKKDASCYTRSNKGK